MLAMGHFISYSHLNIVLTLRNNADGNLVRGLGVVQRKLLSFKNKLSLCSLFFERPVMKSLKTQRRIYNQLHRRSYVRAATLFLALLLLLFQG